MFKTVKKGLMMMILGVMFMMSNQPMSMVMVMMMVFFYFSFILYLSLSTFWYSYVMILVMVSGVMVIFTYMASMVPNEKFEFNFLVMMMLMVLVGKKMVDEWSEDLSFNMVSLWEGSILYVNLFMVGYLMVMMFIVVWMSELNLGPVRS